MTHENQDYIQALHAKGYRVTPQRLIVLDAVCAHQGHATLADIQAAVNEMDPTIDRSTIYRALDVLKEVGLVVESEISESGKVYRIAGESDHLHLECLACHQILTVRLDAISAFLQHFRDTYGFDVQADHLVLKGFCQSCCHQR